MQWWFSYPWVSWINKIGHSASATSHGEVWNGIPWYFAFMMPLTLPGNIKEHSTFYEESMTAWWITPSKLPGTVTRWRDKMVRKTPLTSHHGGNLSYSAALGWLNELFFSYFSVFQRYKNTFRLKPLGAVTITEFMWSPEEEWKGNWKKKLRHVLRRKLKWIFVEYYRTSYVHNHAPKSLDIWIFEHLSLKITTLHCHITRHRNVKHIICHHLYLVTLADFYSQWIKAVKFL